MLWPATNIYEATHVGIYKTVLMIHQRGCRENSPGKKLGYLDKHRTCVASMPDFTALWRIQYPWPIAIIHMYDTYDIWNTVLWRLLTSKKHRQTSSRKKHTSPYIAKTLQLFATNLAMTSMPASCQGFHRSPITVSCQRMIDWGVQITSFVWYLGPILIHNQWLDFEGVILAVLKCGLVEKQRNPQEGKSFTNTLSFATCNRIPLSYKFQRRFRTSQDKGNATVRKLEVWVHWLSRSLVISLTLKKHDEWTSKPNIQSAQLESDLDILHWIFWPWHHLFPNITKHRVVKLSRKQNQNLSCWKPNILCIMQHFSLKLTSTMSLPTKKMRPSAPKRGHYTPWKPPRSARWAAQGHLRHPNPLVRQRPKAAENEAK